MGILQTIIGRKKERLKEAKASRSLTDLKHMIRDQQPPLNFAEAIRRRRDTGLRLIAEIKKASPSKGLIKERFDHMAIAEIYEQKEVAAVSVLTEADFFQGNISFLSNVRNVLSRPLLRKDFLFDEYQIYESRANSADAILLIAAALGKNQASEYLELAKELGLAVLFEVHSFSELEVAISIGSDIVGINNRDLGTLSVDLQTTFELKQEVPPGKIVVSESGIRTTEDVERLQNAGIDAVLIGTSFMEAEDLGKKIDALFPRG